MMGEIIIKSNFKKNPPATSRFQIEEGLKRLRDVQPAGETYMHEGIKKVVRSPHLHPDCCFADLFRTTEM